MDAYLVDSLVDVLVRQMAAPMVPLLVVPKVAALDQMMVLQKVGLLVVVRVYGLELK